MTESTKSSKTPKRNGSWWRKNWFYTVLIAVAVIGGLSAFGLPLIVSQPFSAGDSISTLRQAILAATGGVLAILTLWENRRKNIQEKDKNDQDHTRQVHAERRARYAKAIEQLADDKSAIRLGGVYTLAKLVDDWLDDEKTLTSMEKRRQEGQIIIDSLCAYIRSSFPLAERHDELTLSYEEYQQKYQDKTPLPNLKSTKTTNNLAKSFYATNQFLEKNRRSVKQFWQKLKNDSIAIRIRTKMVKVKLNLEHGHILSMISQTQFFSTTPNSIIVILVIHQVSLGQPSPRTLASLERPSRTHASTRQPSPRTLTSLERPSRTLTSLERPSRTLTSPGRPFSKMLTSPRRSSRISQYLNTH